MDQINTIKTGLKNMSYLTLGSLFSQFLGFFFVIYAARILGPSEFGIFNTVGAFVGLFMVFTVTGYQKVIIRESAKYPEKLHENMESVFAQKILFALIAVFLAVGCGFLVEYDFRIIVFVFIFSFTLFTHTTISLFQVVFHSRSQMKYIAWSGIFQKLIYIIPTALCLYFGGGVEFLVVLFTLSSIVNVFFNYYLIRNKFGISFELRNLFRLRFNKNLFNQAFIFSILGFIGVLYSKIDIAMLSWFVNQRAVGLYSAAYKLLLPVEMLSRQLSVSFFPLAVSRIKKEKSIKASELFKASFLIALVILPASAVVSILSKDIIKLLYGTRYAEANLVLRYLVWIIPLIFIAKPFTIAVQASQLEKKLILPNLLRAISNVVFNYVLVGKYGYMGIVYSTIITYSWCVLFINFGYQYYILKKAGFIRKN